MGKFKYRHQKKTKNKFGWSMDMWAINNRCIAVTYFYLLIIYLKTKGSQSCKWKTES
jgi:hypothetical protein